MVINGLNEIANNPIILWRALSSRRISDVTMEAMTMEFPREMLVDALEMEMSKEVSTNFKKLLDGSDEYTNFQIVCKGKAFNVHKAILAGASSVLKAMLSNETLENRSGKKLRWR